MTETTKLVDERGKDYGSPAIGFLRVKLMKEAWNYGRYTHDATSDIEHQRSLMLDHAVDMLLVKLSRLANKLDHADSWADIKGYVECAERCIEETAPCPVKTQNR